MSEKEQFETLMREQLREDEYETITIPQWFIVMLCYVVPANLLFPLALRGDAIVPLVFTLLIGTSIFYYFKHRGIINSFVRQEKPLKQVFREHKEHETIMRERAKVNAPDMQINSSTGTLSDSEEQNWQNIISGYDATTQPKKKRWGWKKNR